MIEQAQPLYTLSYRAGLSEHFASSSHVICVIETPMYTLYVLRPYVYSEDNVALNKKSLVNLPLVLR